MIPVMDLRQAEISYGVAIIPDSPLKEEIARASLAITAKYENENIIDNKKWPAHISVFLGGTDHDLISVLTRDLESLALEALGLKLVCSRLYSGARGFIGIEVAKTVQLDSWSSRAIAACAAFHKLNPRYRPHLLRHWGRLSSQQQKLLAESGTYKIDEGFHPHLSVAQVDDRDLNGAIVIARSKLQLPTDSQVRAVQLVEVGHSNEKWNVLREWN